MRTTAGLLLGTCLSFLLLAVSPNHASPFGPKYPVTAAWFRDRFSYADWNRTLAQFQTLGGDTVILRAPPIVKRTRDDLVRDKDFAWCGSKLSSTGVSGIPCYDEAVIDLNKLGLNVKAFLTYKYEEGFSDDIMLCPNVDRKINSSRIYYRIVLPAGDFDEKRQLCDFPNGSDVVVLFTSFAGTDPHSLLLDVATDRNMTVYFGLPAAPSLAGHRSLDPASSRGLLGRGQRQGQQGGSFDTQLMGAYYGWVYRVIHEHHARYSKVKGKEKVAPRSRRSSRSRSGPLGRSVYNNTLAGYYSTDECFLAQVNSSSPVVTLYTRLGKLVHAQPGKKLAVSPSIDLTTYRFNASVQQHVRGFQAIASTGQVDVIAVQEGRGAGRGGYYWPTQKNVTVRVADPTLDKILHYVDPSLKENITFGEAFTGSIQENISEPVLVNQKYDPSGLKYTRQFREHLVKLRELMFAALEQSHDALCRGHTNVTFDFWLNVEAFEYLRDDPCLPVDTAGSGNDQMLNRVSKGRLDRALGVSSSRVQMVASFAWDPDFTCTTNQYKYSLAAQIRASFGIPLVTRCDFHSEANKSIVVIGYNMEGLQQGFQINWPSRGKRQTSHLYGYYFELDWGVQHNRIPSLEYTQLYDLPNVLTDLDPKGWVSVKAIGDPHACVFEYDFSRKALAEAFGRKSSSSRLFYRSPYQRY